ncbi:MAG: hypothetical protein QOD98_642 [Nocardioidaceae bacterium]|nr:hypothetical protein [Nocardioidaceae bacterium]
MTDTPAQEFRAIGSRFGEVAAGVRPDQWDDPSPVKEWTARDVVRHLVEWFPPFLSSGAAIDLPPGPSVDDDPASADLMLSNPHIGSVAVPQAVSQFFTGDVFMHTWDLARASGQDDTLDPDRCAEMVAGMDQYEEAMRGSGQYGARVLVPDDADAQSRLLGFIGRDPQWGAQPLA